MIEQKRFFHPVALLYKARRLQKKIKAQQNPDLRKVLEQRLKQLEGYL